MLSGSTSAKAAHRTLIKLAPGEEFGQCRRYQVRIERFRILRFPQQADDHADDEAEHACDGRVPHVGDLIDFEVGEAFTEKKNLNFINGLMKKSNSTLKIII